LERLVAVKKAQDTILICPPVISQHAACGALDAGRDFWSPHIGALDEVRRLVLERLREISDIARVVPAQGAFYLLLEVRTSLGQMSFVERLVRDFRVAVIPGETFGLARGCVLRISYGALEQASVVEAVDRLVQGVRALCKEHPQ
jgi:aspartate/methionine/tyrosine aminotransferase